MATKTAVRSLSKSNPLLTAIPNIHRIAKALTGLTALSAFSSQLSQRPTEASTTSIAASTESLFRVVGPAIVHALPESDSPFDPANSLPAVSRLVSRQIKGESVANLDCLAEVIELGLLLSTATYTALTRRSSQDKKPTFEQPVIVHPIFLPSVPRNLQLGSIPNLRANLERASHAVWDYCYSEGALSDFEDLIAEINRDIQEGVQHYNELLEENLDERSHFQIQTQHFIEVREALDPVTARLRELSKQKSKRADIRQGIEDCRDELERIQEEAQRIGQESGAIGDLVFSTPSYLARTFDKETTFCLLNNLGHILRHDKVLTTKYLSELTQQFREGDWEEVRTEIERVVGPRRDPEETRQLLRAARRVSRQENELEFHSDESEEAPSIRSFRKSSRTMAPLSATKGTDITNIRSGRTRSSISQVTDNESDRDGSDQGHTARSDAESRERQEQEEEEERRRAKDKKQREKERREKEQRKKEQREKEQREKEQREKEQRKKEKEEAKRRDKEKEEREEREKEKEVQRRRKEEVLQDGRERLASEGTPESSSGQSSRSKSVRFDESSIVDYSDTPVSPRTRSGSMPGSYNGETDYESVAHTPSDSRSSKTKRDKKGKKPQYSDYETTGISESDSDGNEAESIGSDRSQPESDEPDLSDTDRSNSGSDSEHSETEDSEDEESEFERFTPVKKVKETLGHYSGTVGKSRIVAWNRVGFIGTRVCVELRVKDSQGRHFYTGRVEPGSGYSFSRDSKTNIEAMNPITEERDSEARVKRKKFDPNELELGLVFWDTRETSKPTDVLTVLRPSRQSYTAYPLTYVEVKFPDRADPYVIPRRRLAQLFQMSTFEVSKMIYDRATRQEKAFTRAQGKKFHKPLPLRENEENEYSRRQRKAKIKRLLARDDATDSESEQEERIRHKSRRRGISSEDSDCEDVPRRRHPTMIRRDSPPQRRSRSARSESVRVATPSGTRGHRTTTPRDRSHSPLRASSSRRSSEGLTKRKSTPRRSPRQSNTSKKRRPR